MTTQEDKRLDALMQYRGHLEAVLEGMSKISTWPFDGKDGARVWLLFEVGHVNSEIKSLGLPRDDGQ